MTHLKPRDYEGAAIIEAPSCYAAWTALKGTEAALQPGDVLESEAGELRIYKYIGFEEAQWQLPEAKPASESSPAPV
jgi:hypothetical protein